MTDWIAAMQRRHSVRRYLPDDPPEEALAVLQASIDAMVPLDAQVRVTVQLVPFQAIGSRSAVGAGPVVGQAPWYLIGRAEPQPGRMEELGFRMEQVILLATDQGLGTCWMGGFYRIGELAELLGCPAADILVISPVGLAASGRRQDWTQAVVHGVSARQGQRKPLTDFAFWRRWGEPVQPEQVPAPVWTALEMARLAPSWSNVQPWYFLLGEEEVLALGDSRPHRGNNRPGKPYYRLDVGIAMCHFWLALDQLGRAGRWRPARGEEVPALQGLDIPAHIVPIGTLAL